MQATSPTGLWLAALALVALGTLGLLVRLAAKRFRISRQVTHVALLAGLCVFYLALAVLVTLGLREWQGTAGTLAGIALFAAGAVWLVRLAGSAMLTRRLRVLVNKHFYRSKHDYRVEWLRFARKMSTVATQDVHAVSIETVADVFSCANGVLYVLDENARVLEPAATWFKRRPPAVSRAPAIDMDSPMVGELLARGWIIDTQEYRETPALYGGVPLPEWVMADRNLRLLSPILRADKLVGVLALGPPPGNFELTYEDRDLLATLGQHIGTHLAQYDADRRIAESKQFEAFNQLTAFMMHDLKNAVAQLRLVVSNAEKHKRNPAFVDDAVVTIGNAVTRIDRLIAQLRIGAREPASSRVRIDEVVNAAIARCAIRRPIPVIDGSLPAELVEADGERLVSAVEHAIRNAQDATTETGSVRIRVQALPGERVSLDICDDGAGMDADFVRERLFKPFDTTKGAAGMGIGAYQVREYARSLGGAVEVQSTPGSGTRFAIILPTVKVDASHV